MMLRGFAVLVLVSTTACSRGKTTRDEAFAHESSKLRPGGSSKLKVVFVNDIPFPAASASAAIQNLLRPAKTAPSGPQHSTPSQGRLRWKVPERWRSVTPSSAMRLAQYDVFVEPGQQTPLQMAVYYFGRRGAGDVDETFRRWASAFGTNVTPRTESWKTEKLSVSVVRASGDYHTEMMASAASGVNQEQVRKDWALLGAYVQTPEGPYYFKLLGPEKLVHEADNSFVGLLRSLTWARVDDRNLGRPQPSKATR